MRCGRLASSRTRSCLALVRLVCRKGIRPMTLAILHRGRPVSSLFRCNQWPPFAVLSRRGHSYARMHVANTSHGRQAVDTTWPAEVRGVGRNKPTLAGYHIRVMHPGGRENWTYACCMVASRLTATCLSM
jgi:hypothetical protein